MMYKHVDLHVTTCILLAYICVLFFAILLHIKMLLLVLFAACFAEQFQKTPPTSAGYKTDCRKTTTPWKTPGTVGYVVCNPGNCATAQIGTLSRQVYNNTACNAPTLWASIAGVPGLDVSATGVSQFPFMQKNARDALVGCVTANRAAVGADMIVTSALRVSPQQHLLYQWYQTKSTCVGIAAVPGQSNHQTGIAVDVSNYQQWLSSLQSYNFAQLPGDAIHFDFTGTLNIDPSVAKTNDIRSFQALWNLNNPNDRITVNGVYDAATAFRFDKSPSAGFANTQCAPF